MLSSAIRGLGGRRRRRSAVHLDVQLADEVAPALALGVEERGEPIGGTPEEFAQFIAGEIQTWGAVVKSAGFSLD